MKNRLFLRCFFWALTLAIMVFIFIMSNQTRAVSSQTSASVIRFFLNFFNFLDESVKTTLIASLQFVVRKAAHLTVYAALGIFSYSAMLTYSIKSKMQILTSIIICVLYSVSDEIHQLLVGRGGRFYDVGIDFVGSLIGILFVFLIFKIITKRRNKNA